MTSQIPMYQEPAEEDRDCSKELFSSWGYKRIAYCPSSPFDALPQGCYLEHKHARLWVVSDPGGNCSEDSTAEGAIAAYREFILGEKLTKADERYDDLSAKVAHLERELAALRTSLTQVSANQRGVK